jgi:hypothetical protein
MISISISMHGINNIKIVVVRAIKAYRRSGDITSFILNLEIKLR